MFYSPETLKATYERLPDSELLIYRGVGNGLLEFREKDFERDVLRFLRSEGPRGEPLHTGGCQVFRASNVGCTCLCPVAQ